PRPPPAPGHRPGRAGPLPEPVMAGRTRLANDAWEALLSAHARLMKQFAAEDIWQDLSMREYDVLYTLSKCREPARVGELHLHGPLPSGVPRALPPVQVPRAGACRRAPPARPAQPAGPVPDGRPAGRTRARRAMPGPRRWARRPPVAHRGPPGETAPH